MLVIDSFYEILYLIVHDFFSVSVQHKKVADFKDIKDA